MTAWRDCTLPRSADLRIGPGLGHDIPAALVKTFADAITAAASRTTEAEQRKSAGQEDEPLKR